MGAEVSPDCSSSFCLGLIQSVGAVCPQAQGLVQALVCGLEATPLPQLLGRLSCVR